MIANPVAQFLVLLVAGVTDGIQKIVKPPNAPTILRRTGALTTSAYRIRHIRISRQPLLQDDAVLPAVAEIICV